MSPEQKERPTCLFYLMTCEQKDICLKHPGLEHKYPLENFFFSLHENASPLPPNGGSGYLVLNVYFCRFPIPMA